MQQLETTRKLGLVKKLTTTVLKRLNGSVAETGSSGSTESLKNDGTLGTDSAQTGALRYTDAAADVNATFDTCGVDSADGGGGEVYARYEAATWTADGGGSRAVARAAGSGYGEGTGGGALPTASRSGRKHGVDGVRGGRMGGAFRQFPEIFVPIRISRPMEIKHRNFGIGTPVCRPYKRAAGGGGGWGPRMSDGFPSTIEAYYEANIPPWLTVDHYNQVYAAYEPGATAVSVFKALESSCKNDILQWHLKAQRFMCDESQLLNVITSLSKEITELRQATYDKAMPQPVREGHFRRMATLNSARKKKQDLLNSIADVLVLICRRIRDLATISAAVPAGDVSRTKDAY